MFDSDIHGGYHKPIAKKPAISLEPNLDLLRSLAVLLVIVDHTSVILNHSTLSLGHFRVNLMLAGIFGVDLFFVHTCFVLMGSLERKPHTLDFYIRRIFRIYPLAVAVILVIVLLHLPVNWNPDLVSRQYNLPLRALLANLLLVQNIQGGGYVLTGMWTLPLEVQMYILLPVLYFFVRRNFVIWPLLLIWVFACGLAMRDAAKFNTFYTVIPCFLPGIMAYVLFERTRPRLPAWLFPVFLIGLAIFFLHYTDPRTGWLTCLAVGLGVSQFRQLTNRPANVLFHTVAKYSYGIYLVHFFGLYVGFRIIPSQSVPLQIVTSLLVTAVLAVVGYHLVEAPMIDVGKRIAAWVERRYEQSVPDLVR